MNFFTKLCRLCTSRKDVLLTLNNWDVDHIRFLDKLNEIAPCLLEPCDELPSGICKTCIVQLNDAYQFKKKCFDSQVTLKQYLKIQNKGEIQKKKSEENEKTNKNQVITDNCKDAPVNNYNSVELFEFVNVEQIKTEKITNESIKEENEIKLEEANHNEQINLCNSVEFNTITGNSSTFLNDHHKTNKRYSCKICNKTFTFNSALKRHLRTHSNDKPYECEICGRAFQRNEDLKKHSLIHTNQKPFRCVICEKSFTFNSALSRHFRTHANEKPYICEICRKTFNDLNHFKRHIRIHANVKPYGCKKCNKFYTDRRSIKKHICKSTNS